MVVTLMTAKTHVSPRHGSSSTPATAPNSSCSPTKPDSRWPRQRSNTRPPTTVAGDMTSSPSIAENANRSFRSIPPFPPRHDRRALAPAALRAAPAGTATLRPPLRCGAAPRAAPARALRPPARHHDALRPGREAAQLPASCSSVPSAARRSSSRPSRAALQPTPRTREASRRRHGPPPARPPVKASAW
jgi:hypothetical protein